MQAVKSKLALITRNQQLASSLAEHDPVVLPEVPARELPFDVDILLFDGALGLKPEELRRLAEKKKQNEFSKVVFLMGENSDVSLADIAELHCDHFIHMHELNGVYLHRLWEQIHQKEQDEAYLNLSTELNQQYELLKTELENRLSEKSKNLIESRKQIYEINNRVEILRKSLYATSEIKNIAQAEALLNDLLVGFGVITWLKIIPADQTAAFETDLKTQFESSHHRSNLTISSDSYCLYFFKGDKRSFRKQDLNYFNKITETLQINLNRYFNLLSLQQSERLFDLAFHSSPHPIIIIDDNYHVFQANLAAEKSSEEHDDSLTCYKLLFNRDKPCNNCQLGNKFNIQEDLKSYRVQSNKFSSSVDSSNYWIHLYEDISEQQALESKFQQTARLSELGLISSSIAHELNNPLGGILSYLQIMKMELPAGHPFHADIQYLTEASNRMKKHIEDLLFFSRKDDSIKVEKTEITEIFQKNLDLLQMQFKKEHLIVSYQPPASGVFHDISILHFRNTIHLVFQFFLNKLKIKRQNKSNFSGLVEVKISQDQMGSYLSFASNLGPHDLKLNSNDLSLITLEKSILDQGFQIVISEPKPLWLQVLIKLPF